MSNIKCPTKEIKVTAKIITHFIIKVPAKWDKNEIEQCINDLDIIEKIYGTIPDDIDIIDWEVR